MLDFHRYRNRYEASMRSLLKSPISQRNKDLICKFADYALLQGVTRQRIMKYLDKMRRIGAWLGKDFDEATKQDIERISLIIHENPAYAMSTKIDYNIIIKRFYKWLLGKDEEFPEQAKWLKTTLKYKDKPLPSQADLITEEEVQKLILTADHPRNKAFISILYESGCRVGELCNMKIGNLLFDQYGCVLNVNGKTGPRRIRIVNSTNYIMQWLDMHPFKKDREQPLWVTLNTKTKELIKYSTVLDMLRDLFAKAGINKRCNPHIFRHSRATFMANHMTEAQMKAYFGWVQHSDMASTYVHLSGKDTDKAILELNGFIKKEEQESVIKPKQCPRCSFINSSTSNYCTRCSCVLDMDTAIELQDKLLKKDVQHENLGNLMGTLMEDKEFKDLLFKKLLEMKLTKKVEAL